MPESEQQPKQDALGGIGSLLSGSKGKSWILILVVLLAGGGNLVETSQTTGRNEQTIEKVLGDVEQLTKEVRTLEERIDQQQQHAAVSPSPSPEHQ
jgi:hypothetical protein